MKSKRYWRRSLILTHVHTFKKIYEIKRRTCNKDCAEDRFSILGLVKDMLLIMACLSSFSMPSRHHCCLVSVLCSLLKWAKTMIYFRSIVMKCTAGKRGFKIKIAKVPKWDHQAVNVLWPKANEVNENEAEEKR